MFESDPSQPVRRPRAEIRYTADDLQINELNDPAWEIAENIGVHRYWSGQEAPEGRHFEARILWSAAFLYVRFKANQTEPLVVSDEPHTSKKVIGLWERDVCEIFLAPDERQRSNYFEFEVAPTGEWLDLAIHHTREGRETDREYQSGLEASAKIEKDRVFMAIRVPWKAFGIAPREGDAWAGNLFRALGKGAARGYLAWSPTHSKKPDFHVPDRFGEFVFVK